MAKKIKLQRILGFLGVKEAKDLIGKTMKVSFYSSMEDCIFEQYFLINTFNIQKKHTYIEFPYINTDNNNYTQVSVFDNKEFHIVHRTYVKNGETSKGNIGYYYSTKKYKNEKLERGSIVVV
jgi:hypothetical protein